MVGTRDCSADKSLAALVENEPHLTRQRVAHCLFWYAKVATLPKTSIMNTSNRFHTECRARALERRALDDQDFRRERPLSL
jgi:hypothetical protein